MSRSIRNQKRSRVRQSQTTSAIMAGAVIAVGTNAYASDVWFSNPEGAGHFNWIPSDPSDLSRWLDVTRSAAAQPGAEGSSGVFQQMAADTLTKIGGGPGTNEMEAIPDLPFVECVLSGQIPSGARWVHDPYVFYSGYSFTTPEDSTVFLGVRFDLGSGTQYGAIGVRRQGQVLEAFGWGYETVPGDPFTIPEPGSLAMLALGATALLARRRA